MNELKDKIRKFVIEKFLFGKNENLEDSTSFLEEGITDSIGILNLVNFLEEAFPITVEDEEMLAENLDSINNVIAFLQSKIS